MSSINASKKVAAPASLDAAEPQGVTQYDPAKASRKPASPSSLRSNVNKWTPTPAFSPLDLSPTLWLDASDVSTITESGGAVSQWDNKGSLDNFTQGTASRQPTTSATTLNGLNVLDFANDFMTSADAASAWNDLHNGTQWIFAAVVLGNYPAEDTTYLFGTNGGSASNIGTSTLLEDRSAVGDEVNYFAIFNGGGTNSGPVVNVGNTSSFPRNTWNTISALNDPGNGTAADRSTLYLDGSAVGANNTLTGAPSSSDPQGTLQVGSNGANNSGSALEGSLAELVVVTGANATEANRTKLVSYLGNKWGLNMNIPAKVAAVARTAGNGQVALSWPAVSASLGDRELMDYVVQYSTDDVNWTTFTDGLSTATTATVTGLTNETLYYFRVAAVDADGTGEFSDSVSIKPGFPASLSPALWLDASDATTITESGGSVSQWDDKSGNGYDLTQATGSAQPKTGTATMNSLNVLEYDGANTQSMKNTSVPLNTGGPYTVFMVQEINASDTNVWPVAADSASVYGFGGIVGDASTSLYQNVGTPSLYVNNTEFSGTTRDDVYTAFTNSPAVVRQQNLAPTVDGLRIGYIGGSSYLSNGSKVAEVIVVDGTLTADQISATETYLTNKWIPIPIQLNATAWYDASNSFSITESSGSVSQWDDLSGNGYNLTQGTGTAQPTTGTATMNSLNVLEYDSASDIQFLENTSVPLETNGPYTVLMVQEINASDTQALPVASKQSAGYGFVAEAGSSSTLLTSNWGTPSLYVNGTESSVTTRDDVYTAFTNSPALVRQQGILAVSATYAGLRIGYNGAGYTLSDGSKVAELVVLDDPAPADVATAEQYLADKWGITLQEFSPADLSPTLWLDASDTGTITESGGSVSQWDDKSTNGNDLTQATSANQPTTGTATINGLNALDFDGTSDRLQRAATNLLNATTGAYTAFAVINPSTVSGVGSIVDQDPGGGTRFAQLLRQNGTVGESVCFRGGTNYKDSTASGVLAASTPAIITARANTTDIEVWVDGVSNGSTSTGSGNLNTGTTTVLVGATGGGSPAQFFDGTIGEVIVVDGALTAQQIYDTEQYLANKWGITI